MNQPTYHDLFKNTTKQRAVIELMDMPTIQTIEITETHNIIDFDLIARIMKYTIPYPGRDIFIQREYYYENANAIVQQIAPYLLITPDDDTICQNVKTRLYNLILHELAFPEKLMDYHIDFWVKTHNYNSNNLSPNDILRLNDYVAKTFNTNANMTRALLRGYMKAAN